MRSLFTTICALVPLAFVSPSFAQKAINPGGPWVTPNQNISLEAFRSYEQLTAAITKIADESDGLVAIESIALTAGGRDVWLAKIGDATRTQLIIKRNPLNRNRRFRIFIFLETTETSPMVWISRPFLHTVIADWCGDDSARV